MGLSKDLYIVRKVPVLLLKKLLKICFENKINKFNKEPKNCCILLGFRKDLYILRNVCMLFLKKFSKIKIHSIYFKDRGKFKFTGKFQKRNMQRSENNKLYCIILGFSRKIYIFWMLFEVIMKIYIEVGNISEETLNCRSIF